MRMAKYTGTSIGYFLEIPIDDFYEWIKVMNAEIDRENKAIKESQDKK